MERIPSVWTITFSRSMGATLVFVIMPDRAPAMTCEEAGRGITEVRWERRWSHVAIASDLATLYVRTNVSAEEQLWKCPCATPGQFI